MRIVKKILKWALRVVLIVVGLLLLVSFLVFLPPVQDFIKDKAAAYVSENMGFDLEIERLRLQFPLTLTIDNTVLRLPQGDTLLRVGRLRGGVAVGPLLTGNIEVRRFRLANAGVDYRDSLGTMAIRGTVGSIGLRNIKIKLKDNSIGVSRITISDAFIDMDLGQSPPDTVAADVSDTIPWLIGAGRLELNRVVFNMRTAPDVTALGVTLDRGQADNIIADLAEQEVTVRRLRLERGDYSYLTDTTSVAGAVEADTLPQPESRPWTVRVGRVRLTETSAVYGSLYGEAQPGFDPSHIALSDLNLSIDSVYNRSSDISATIRSLDFRERSGLAVTAAAGRFAMDSAGIRLYGFNLHTASSAIKADAMAGAAIMEMSPDAPLSARVDVSLAGSDLLLFYPADEQMRKALGGKMFTLKGDLGGTLGDLKIKTLTARMPPYLSLDAAGEIRSLTDFGNLGGNLRIDGELRDPGFARDFLPADMRGRIGLPQSVKIAGRVAVEKEVYTPELRLTADNGYADIKGRLDLRAESYNAAVEVRDFPLGTFLPADSLGLVSLGLTAKGRGFDFTSAATSADIGLEIARFDYMGYNHHDITVRATLAENNLSGVLSSGNEALQLDIDVTGKLSTEIYAAHLKGRIGRADLQMMRLSDVPLSVTGVLDISASASPDTTQMIYSLDAALDSLRFQYDDIANSITRTTIRASADRRVKAAVRSGDFSLDFTSPLPLKALMDGFTKVADTIMRQVAERDIDFHPVEAVMPTFNLDVRVGRRNVAHGILEEQGLDFRNITLTAHNTDTTDFRFRGLVESLHTAGLTLDTLNFGLGQRDDRLTWFVRLANKPGNIEQLALIYLYGTIAGDSIQANIDQRNRDGQKGFVFGINARLRDSSVRVSLFPGNPLFAYDTWKVNPGNYLEYHFNNEMYADLSLDNQTRPGHLRIQSVDDANMPRGSVRLDIADLDIGKVLDLMPSPPPVGGLLTTDIAFGMAGPLIAANGSVAVKGLTYESRKVGDIDVTANTSGNDAGLWTINTALGINAKQALTARGTYNMPDGKMDFTLDIPGFPLGVANAFMPPNTATLAGSLKGNVRVGGTSSDPDISGSLNFDGGQISVAMIGTTFGISSEPVRINRDRIRLRNFGITSPNNQLLALDGSIDISDLSRMTADLTITAKNFQAVNAPRNRGSQVYGLAAVDVDMTARGLLDALVLRGDLKVRRTTDVVYTMADSPLSVDNQKQDIVTFVSFADSTLLARRDTMQRVRTGGLDMLVNVDIDNNVHATLNLSDNGNDRIELIGGGSLTYIMNNQGDTRLTGRYDLTGGTVVYNPPIPMIKQKYFTIDEGSYVQWTGEMMDPSFDITATETVRTTVTYTSGATENVNFNITILITGSLEKMGITFDLDAPESYEIRDDLMSMTTEERASQAVALLIYNTYTGPSATAKVDSNNALNSFIEKEINQWARNNLKGIDLSVGIRSDEDEDGGTHNDYSYKVSKSLFNDRMKVTIGGSVSDGTSIQNNASNNLVQDVSLEYRLTQRDNMFIKGYRYTTNDMLDGEVIETGVGFMVRKQMNKLTELFRLTPPPEKREVRERQRERRDSLRTGERQAIRDSSRRFGGNTPEDSARRAAWRARRDSMRRDSTLRPRDPSRFDSIPADSLRVGTPQGPWRGQGENQSPPGRRNDEAIKEED